MNIITAIFHQISNQGTYHILKNWGSDTTICKVKVPSWEGKQSNLQRLRLENKTTKICKNCLDRIKK